MRKQNPPIIKFVIFTVFNIISEYVSNSQRYKFHNKSYIYIYFVAVKVNFLDTYSMENDQLFLNRFS